MKPHNYRIRLDAPRLAAFALAVALVAAAFGTGGARAGLSAWAAEHPGRDSLALALKLDPRNADLHHRLALLLVYQGGFEHWEFQQARGLLERAAALAPRNSAVWSDLAMVCSSLLDRPCAVRALERAIALDPMTPRLHWQAANFHAAAASPESSLRHARRLLEMDPLYAPAVFRLSLGAVGDPAQLDPHLMPAQHQPQLRLALLEFLAGEGHLDAARRTWQLIAGADGNRGSFHYSAAQPYIERLIGERDAEQSGRVWDDLVRLGVVKAARFEANSNSMMNIAVNGGFEQQPLGSGLDWRWAAPAGVWLDFADAAAHSGSRALRLDFVGERNDEYELVSQLVPLSAGRTYRFSAWVRSDALTSDSGPRLRLADPHCETCPVTESAMVTGTTRWHRLETEFNAGVAQRFVRISLRRARSRTFPTQISGRFWLDDVSLAEM